MLRGRPKKYTAPRVQLYGRIDTRKMKEIRHKAVELGITPVEVIELVWEEYKKANPF